MSVVYVLAFTYREDGPETVGPFPTRDQATEWARTRYTDRNETASWEAIPVYSPDDRRNQP